MEWLAKKVGENIFWQGGGEVIRGRPKWVAKMTGIEATGCLRDIRPSEPLPTPKEIHKLWWDHAKVQSSERRKVRERLGRFY
jgi:hypothetical protein